MSTLPLRLWAPPHLNKILNGKRHFIVDIPKNEACSDFVCAVLDEHGILGIVTDKKEIIAAEKSGEGLDHSQVIRALGIDDLRVFPEFVLVRSRGTVSGDGRAVLLNVNREICSKRETQRIAKPTARRIVNGINNYYTKQILEPSVKGFLFILEKQFPRNDLYLFELLQNAVDDGASVVKFQCLPNLNGGTLRFTHDGRIFSPIDVVGLSSVGLSTKTSNRTVGFMGIGFKAVYKRFFSVHVSDGTWSFQFQKPELGHGSTDKSNNHGWVMLPQWTERAQGKEDRGWCKFDLSRTVGGIEAVMEDLKYIPVTCPPLLGRTALRNISFKTASKKAEEKHSWTLEWHYRKFHVSYSDGSQYGSNEKIIVMDNNMKANKTRSSTWVFLSTKFRLGKLALGAYMKHTKKEINEGHEEELCIFFRISTKTGAPMVPRYANGTSSGRLHSVLPTKIKMPFGFHVQGTWLLSVDRLDIQDSFENDWNRECLNQLPTLMLKYLEWVATSNDGVAASKSSELLTPCYDMFACEVERDKSVASPRCTLKMIGVPLDFLVVEDALKTKPLLPSIAVDAVSKNSVVTFISGDEGVLLPPAFAKRLRPSWIYSWLGLKPIDTTALGGNFIGSRILDTSVSVINSHAISESAVQLKQLYFAKEMNGESKKSEYINFLSAFGESLYNFTRKEEKQLYESSFGSWSTWSIFPAANGKIVASSELCWPDEDYFKLPQHLQAMLQPYLSASSKSYKHSSLSYQKEKKQFEVALSKWEKDVRNYKNSVHSRGKNGNKGRHRRQKRGNVNPPGQKPLAPTPPCKKTILDPALRTAIYGISNDSEKRNLLRLLDFVKECNPDAFVSTESLIEQVFRKYVEESCGNGALISKEIAENLVHLTVMLYKQNDAVVLPYVLCDVEKESSYRLIPGPQAFLPSNYGTQASTLLSQLWTNAGNGKPKLHFVSGIYFNSDQNLEWSSIFITNAKVNDGLQFVAKRGSNSVTKAVYQTKTKEMKLPIRKTKKEVGLPYFLGEITNSNKSGVSIDLDFGPFFIWVLEHVGTEQVPTKALNAFLSLLLQSCESIDRKIFAFPGLMDEERKPVRVGVSHELRPSIDGCSKTEHPSVTQGILDCYDVLAGQVKMTSTRHRLFYLPPASRGCHILDIKPATWVQRLVEKAWVPVNTAKTETAKGEIGFVRPSAAKFAIDENRTAPSAHLQETTLPIPFYHTFKRNGLFADLRFGTKAPPSPIERFREFARKFSKSATNSHSGSKEDLYKEAVEIWSDLLERETSRQDNTTLKVLCKKYGLIPGDDNLLLPPYRFCCSPVAGKADPEEKVQLRNALLASKWVFDISKGPLYKFAEQFINIFEIASYPNQATCEAFLKNIYAEDPSQFLESKKFYNGKVTIKECFSTAYLLALKTCCFGNQSRYISLNEAARNPLVQLALYSPREKCIKWIRYRDVVLDKSTANNKVRVYLNDNWKKEILLRGVLESKNVMKVCLPDIANTASMFYGENMQIAKSLHLPCLSDNSLFSVGIKSFGKSVELPFELERIKDISAILQKIDDFSQVQLKIPSKLIHCEKLMRISKVFGDSPIKTDCWCAWLGHSTIKVQGDVEDYVAELTEELLRRLPRYQPRPPPKLLYLLNYIGNDKKFRKFAARYFDHKTPEVIEHAEEALRGGKTCEKRQRDALGSDESETVTKKRKVLDETDIKFGESDKVENAPSSDVPETKEAKPSQETMNFLNSVLENNDANVNENKEDTCVSSGVQNAQTSGRAPVVGVGRGKNINLPAWMTMGNPAGQQQDVPNVVLENKEVTVSEINDDAHVPGGVQNAQTSGRAPGVGRGKNINLPAWMTMDNPAGQQQDVPNVVLENKEVTVSENNDDAHVPSGAQNGVRTRLAISSDGKQWRELHIGSEIAAGRIDHEQSFDISGVGLVAVEKG